jgi:hypothetical protein
MECEKEVGTVGNSGHGAAMAGRTLYPLPPLRLVPAPAANEREPSWIDADLADRDALISVWWDYYPSGGDAR